MKWFKFWKKEKARVFTAEELQAMGISVFVPKRIEPTRIEPSRIEPNRATLNKVELSRIEKSTHESP